MSAVLLFGIFFALLFLNVPIAMSLGVSSIITTMAVKPAMMSTIAANLYSSTNTYVLLAIPFFILAGNIMDVSGISVRLINFFNSLVGHTKHGTAMVCVIVACFFAAISGSGPATVAALGGILIPAMSKSGYEKDTSAALMSTAGAIGIVIPPSITFVVYGSVTGTSVGDLFMAGIIPGILIGVAIYFTMVISSRGCNLVRQPKASGKERWKLLATPCGAYLCLSSSSAVYTAVFSPRPKPLRFRRFTDL